MVPGPHTRHPINPGQRWTLSGTPLPTPPDWLSPLERHCPGFPNEHARSPLNLQPLSPCLSPTFGSSCEWPESSCCCPPGIIATANTPMAVVTYLASQPAICPEKAWVHPALQAMSNAHRNAPERGLTAQALTVPSFQVHPTPSLEHLSTSSTSHPVPRHTAGDY